MKNFVLGVSITLVLVLITLLVYIWNINIASCYVENGENVCISQTVGNYVFSD